MAVSTIAIASSLAGAYAGTFATGAVAVALTQGIVGTVVAGALSGLVSKDEQDNNDQLAEQQASALVNKASNNAPLPVVYGLRKIGGTRVFMETSGNDNEYLHVVIAMSEGEINSFENVYLNNIISTDSRFNSVLNVYTHTGADNQTADSNLVADLPNWTSAHRLRGTAYVYVKLKYDQDAYSSGLPTITADLKGTKVFDPRSNAIAWSDNPILAIRDYLTNTRYGRGIASSLIDDTSFIASANYCDTTVTLAGATVKRYTTNGIVNTSQGSMNILKQLLTSCKGFLIFSGGQYKIVIDKPETAGFTFSEDNIIGQWKVSLGSKNNQFNRIRANFINKNKDWQPDIAVVESASLRTLDNGILLEKSISLPYTTDIDRAKMITTININQSRQKISCEFTSTIEGLKAEVGDVVYIKHSTVGWQYLNASAGKKFRIIKMSLQNNDEVRVQAVEYADASYNFGTIYVSDSAPNTNLPDVTTTKIPVGLSVTEELYVTNTGQGVQVRANLTWTAPTDAFAQYYEVEYAQNSGAFEFVTQTRATSAPVNNLQAGNFSFRVRTVNTIGVRSAYTTITTVLAGLTTPPSQITNFSVRAIDGSAHMEWDRSVDVDVIHGGFLRIRHSNLITGAIWEGGSDIGQALAGTSTNAVLPLLAGTYMIKAVDSAGNFATDSTSSITTVPNILDFNVVSTTTESPTFAGTKVNMVVVGQVLRLTDVSDVVSTSGSYAFNSTIDLGQSYTSRVSANLVYSGYLQGTDIDSRANLVDTWLNWDGEPSDKITALLQVRTTLTDPAGTPTWTAWSPLIIGDFQARGYQFRVIVTSTDSSRNIDISALSVEIDMPDRNERAINVNVPTSGLNVTYDNPFKETPFLGITGKNMDSNQSWTLTNETRTGFSIIIYDNSSSQNVSKNINWIATGFGRGV
tara:strand:+ start:1573 stop:4323 length:2751 start_codon:yes stop_codon:yes gene_type:complete